MICEINLYIYTMTKGQELDLEKVRKDGIALANKYPELFTKINEPKYTIGDIGLNARVINYWEKKDLLINKHDVRKRKRFGLADALWMKMIQKMRQFDISLDAIHNVKGFITDKVEVGEDNREVFEKTVLEMFDSEKQQVVKSFMETKEFEEVLDKMNLSYLQIIVIDVIVLRNQYSLLINAQGDVVPFKHSEIEALMENEYWRRLFNNSHITLSFNELLEGLALEIGDEEATHMHIISETELEVLNAMKEDGVKSIEINMAKDGRKRAERIVLKKEEAINDSKRIKEIFLRNKYEDITVKSENGVLVYCERKEKRKLK